QGSLIASHDYPGVGAPDKSSAIKMFGRNPYGLQWEGHDALQFSCSRISSAALRITPTASADKSWKDRPFQMRVSEQFLRTVDDWRRYQTDLPSRAEAIRRLVELATKIKKKPDTDR